MYSAFWLAYCAGAIGLHPAFAERDDDDGLDFAEVLDMRAWLALTEAQRAAIVEGYAQRRPALQADRLDGIRLRRAALALE